MNHHKPCSVFLDSGSLSSSCELVLPSPFTINTNIATQHQHSVALDNHTFPRSALARAYLQQRRRHPDGPIQVCTVVDNHGSFVDFGLPCEWTCGTAQRVANHEYKLDYFLVDHCDLDVAEAVDHDQTFHLRTQSTPTIPIQQQLHQKQPSISPSPSPSATHSPSSSDSIPSSPFSLSSTEFDSDDGHHLHPHRIPHDSRRKSREECKTQWEPPQHAHISSAVPDIPIIPPITHTPSPTASLSPSTAAAAAVHPSVSVADIRFMANLTYGVRAAQGQRSSMEDEHADIMAFEQLVAKHVESPDDHGRQAFFGVYDGHGGSRAALFLHEHLHVNIARSMIPGRSVDQAIRTGTAETERQLIDHQIQMKCSSGAVAAYLLFNGRQLYCANAGDSRVVLCRAGKAVDLTVDHRPGAVIETERIIREGGTVEYGHLNGELAVSRAFGDVDPATGVKMRGLSSSPDLHQYFLTDDDDFLIVACDGLWDVLSSEGAVSFARHSLAQHQDCQKTSDDLVAEALRRHSEDNITVMVIGFGKTHENGEQYIVEPPRLGPLASLTHTPHGPTRTRALSRSVPNGFPQPLSVHALLAATANTTVTNTTTSSVPTSIIPTITQSPKPPQRRRIQLSSLSNLLAKLNHDDTKDSTKHSSHTVSSTATTTATTTTTTTSTSRSLFIRSSVPDHYIPRSPHHDRTSSSSSFLLTIASQDVTPVDSPTTTPPERESRT